MVKLRSDDSSNTSESSSSDSDLDSSDSGGDSSVEMTRGRVDISSQQLQSMHAVASNRDSTMSEYAKNGRSRTRIKDAIGHPACTCRCVLPYQLLLRVCIAFWALTKKGQDTVLWSIQQEEEESSKRDWFIEGLLV